MDRYAILSLVREIVRSTLHPVDYEVFLFGSFARGEERASSDIDIAVQVKDEIPSDLLSELRWRLEESSIPYHVDVIDLRSAHPELRAQVTLEGIKWDD